MKKEKGFTLIELLAVIVILAILMVVAVPKILNVIENSRKSAAESSIKLVKDAIKTQVASGNIVGNNLTSDENGCYLFNFDDQNSGNAKELNVKNKEKIKGTIKYCNGIFSEDTLVFDNVEKKQPAKIICKRATTLHTEECKANDSRTYCSGSGYTESGSKGTTTITYGNLGTSGTLTSGDAFDCDVNGDGVYDENTERFYYVSDYYNTKTKEFESDTAALIYYNNVSGGNPTNSKRYKYSTETKENYHGPLNAITELPTISQWTNVNLKNISRDILAENENNQTGLNESTGLKTLPNDFSYSGYAARLLTTMEVNKACNIKIGNARSGELDTCNYLMENTKYSLSNNAKNLGYWLENPMSENSKSVWATEGYYRRISGSYNNEYEDNGVRPAIDVLKSNIEY